MNADATAPADPLLPSWMAINSSAARLRRESVLEGYLVASFKQPEPLSPSSLAAARENLDSAIATLLEAATAEVCEEAQLRKALQEGEQREHRRLQAILLHRLDLHPYESDPVRGELLQLLEAIAK